VKRYDKLSRVEGGGATMHFDNEICGIVAPPLVNCPDLGHVPSGAPSFSPRSIAT
jgi:hypothetical protein